MPTHPVLIRNHLHPGDGPGEVLLVHSGHVIAVAPPAQWIGTFSDDGNGGLVAPARAIGGGAGYLDASGRWVVAPELDDACPFYGGLAAYRVGTLWGFMRHDGTRATAPQWSSVQRFHDGLAAVQVAPGAWRYLDTRGEFAFDGQFAEAGPFRAHGLAAARRGQAVPAGYLDKQGRWAIAPRFDQAGDFCAGGAAPVAVGEHMVGLIDTRGAWIAQPHYRFIHDFNADGLAFFGQGENSFACDTGFLDARGDRFFPGTRPGREHMVGGMLRKNHCTYVTRQGACRIPGLNWGCDINEQGFAVGRSANRRAPMAGESGPQHTWGIVRTDGSFAEAPANALEPLTDSASDGLLLAPEPGTPLAVFIGDDDDLLMIDRDARIAYRLRCEATADGRHAALYDADARLLWTGATSERLALPERFFVPAPHTLMDQLSSPEGVIEHALAMLRDAERKLHLLLRDGHIDGALQQNGIPITGDVDAVLARILASRSRILGYTLNKELVGKFGFADYERTQLLSRIQTECVERLISRFGPADHEPDFANRPDDTYFDAWPVSLATPLPGAGDAPEANRLWLALHWCGGARDGSRRGEVWLTCAPSLATLDLVLDACASQHAEKYIARNHEKNEPDQSASATPAKPQATSHDALLALVSASPAAIGALADEQITAELADAATAAHAGALEHLPERFHTPQRLDALIRKSLDSARQVPDACMSARGLALARALYGGDERWTWHDALRCIPRTDWHQNTLRNYWGALIDTAMSERALRAGILLQALPRWLRTPRLEALALEENISNIAAVGKQTISAGIAERAVAKRYAGLLKCIPAHLVTPALCLVCVQNGGEMLAQVPAAMRSIEVCTAAVMDDLGAIAWVPLAMHEEVCTRVIDADLAMGADDRWAIPLRGRRYALRARMRACRHDYPGAAVDAALALGLTDLPAEAHFLLALSWRALGRAFDSALEAASVLAIERAFSRPWPLATAWLRREARAALCAADDEALLRGLQTHPLALSTIPQRRITAEMANVAVTASPDALAFVPKQLMTKALRSLAGRCW